MATSTIGLSHDLIIHPGETLREVLDSRGISQKQLSVQTGFTPQHISRVINGTTNISSGFSQKLEYALGVPASFWINLQANYDLELAQYEDISGVSPQELDIVKKLKEVLSAYERMEIIERGLDSITKVISLRRIFGIANLTVIPRLQMQTLYRTASAVIDIYVMFAWHKLCDLMASRHCLENKLNIQKLRLQIQPIKGLMDKSPRIFLPQLETLFSDCGISFCVVPHFKGAPVQGFIKLRPDNTINLCMTIRQARADIFWFTLFHEIAHIVNEDFDDQFTDFKAGVEVNGVEDRANEFARDALITPESYATFIEMSDFSMVAIECLAKINNVPPHIAIGRLQKEKHIPWSQYASEIVTYAWKKEKDE